MKKLYYLTILAITFACQICYADCQGCCSSNGGVECINGTTKCADGTPLSNTCLAKGCDECELFDSGGGCFINGLSYSNFKLNRVSNTNYNNQNTTVKKLTYNKQGQLKLIEFFENRNLLWKESFYYSGSKLVKIETITNGDENNNMVTKFDYLSDGRISKKIFVYSEKTDMVEFYYNFDGLLIEECHDINLNGNIDYRIQYYYDDKKQLLKKNECIGDLFIVQSEIYTYDNFGKMNRIKRDIDNDGIYDELESFYYSEMDNSKTVKTDINLDGIIDEVKYYLSDALGRMTVYKYDKNNDGMIDWEETYNWSE